MTTSQLRSMSQRDKYRFWQAHVEAMGTFAGSVEQYCQERGISYHSFMAWRTRLRKSRRLEQSEVKAFVPVTIEHQPGPALPDPQWLALFLRSWMQGELR